MSKTVDVQMLVLSAELGVDLNNARHGSCKHIRSANMAHINVALRVRPGGDAATDFVTVVPPGDVVIHKPGSEDMYHFSYTTAAQGATNAEVYDQVGQPVVDSVLDGFNGTVLAYGQTGSGARLDQC
jgi:Kinesin motor domain